MAKIDSKPISVHMSDIELQKSLGMTHNMRLEDAIMILARRVILLEDQLADYGLLVHEENGDVRIQSKSDKNS